MCESLVCDYLVDQGYAILCRNYSCPFGELDIISTKDDVLCITEVKSLSSRWESSDIMHMVPPSKMAKMRRTLSHYLANNETDRYKAIRFDVASVTGTKVEYYCGDE